MKTVLFGSPAFAVPVLDRLHADFNVAAVVTQPAKPAGRGMRLRQPPLAVRAHELGLEVVQPARLKGNTEFAAWLADLEPDVAVTAAYGRILPAALLSVPREGFLNVHASLLPRWRGAAPIQWALIAGDQETGISIMQTEEGLDTGPVRLQRTVTIGPAETAPELFHRLAAEGAEAAAEALALLSRGELPLEPQDAELVTLAPPLTREDGRLDFTRPARDSWNRFRGVAAWPGTFFRFSGSDVRVTALQAVPDAAGPPGHVLAVREDGLLVGSGAGALLLGELQSPGRRKLPGRDWANGAGVKAGTSLTDGEE